MTTVVKTSAPTGMLLCVAAIAIGSADAQTEKESTLAELHSTSITPASDALFKVESAPPKSAKEWAAVERSAKILTQAATKLQSNAIARDQKQWLLLSRSLRTEANSAAIAAKQSDLNELIAANGRIVAICESCHDDYRDNGHGMTSDKKSDSKP